MSWVCVAKATELSDSMPLPVSAGDVNLAVVAVGDEIFAIEDLCSHGHVALSEGDVDADNYTIECYLHGAEFDLRTGRACSLPATQPVPVYPCRIDGDDIVVDLDHPVTEEK